MSPREVLSVVIAAASNPGRRTALQGCLVVDEVLDGKGALFHSRRRRTPLKVNRRVRCCVLISVAVSTQGENEGGEKESAHRDDAGGGRRHGNRRRGACGRDDARGHPHGAAEVNGAGDPNQGDLDGSGEATLNLIPKKERICYTLTVRDIAPAQAALIHKAPAGENGPIVKELKAPSDGSSEGCARLSRMKIKMIKNNPAGYYVNVHNGAFPNGALRGQLTPAGP